MVKVVEITEFGDPSVLKITNKDTPKLQTNEVLVENKSIGLNFIDTYHRSRALPHSTSIWNWFRSCWNC